MYTILNKIKSPKDLKELKKGELSLLCDEIRMHLVDTVSKTGGHLAGNLGVVELTVALHRVLDAPGDKIVWDVGHQSYVHKILTGRAGSLSSLRKLDGICGFCSPKESEYDVSYTGHASASLSTAAGIAASRDISGENFKVAAVIGDGAFTGGLAFEALNNIGHKGSRMLIILNDNEMSISENVGAFSKFLSRARTNQRYTASKRKIIEKIRKLPGGGDKVINALQKIKNHIKSAVAPNLLFESLGITYLGPVNGHSIEDMEYLFARALALDEPVLVHVITKKGKGYIPAEEKPDKFHGIAPFEKETGELKNAKTDSFCDVFGDELCSIAEKNPDVVAITPAMLTGSGLEKFSHSFPDRFYDVGIAEGYAVAFAGGLSLGGKTPVVAIYSTFLQRAYDNIIHDVALGNQHVVFAVDRAGLVPGDGATHQGLFDISYLTSVPNMTVLSPSSYSELRKMLAYAINEHRGPIALRYPRGGEEKDIDNGGFVLSRASVVKSGDNVTIVSQGQCVAIALAAANLLEEKGISAEVIDARTIKPLDFETIFESARKTGALYSIEENLMRGGMGEMIASEAKVRALDFKVKIKAIGDEFVKHGTIDQINEYYGFTAEKTALDVERMLKD